MARQLNTSCNFNTRHLICNIPDNMMEVVVKIKTMSLVEDQEKRSVKYRPWGKYNQSCIRMEMVKSQKSSAP